MTGLQAQSPSLPGFRYRAFISYSHTDKKAVSRFFDRLERYKVPKDMRARHVGRGLPAKVFPIFRDVDELPTSSDLGEEITGALQASRFLVVMCSPAAARSQWVNKEILDFKRMHGEDRILAVVLSGEPNAEDKLDKGFRAENECFPEALKYRLGLDGELDRDRRTEPIAADMRPGVGDGEERARFKVLARLLDVNFDELWDREQRRQRRFLVQVAAASVMLVAVFAGITIYAVRHKEAAEAQFVRAERQKEIALKTLRKQTFEIPERLKSVDRALELLQPLIEENLQTLEEVLQGEPETAQTLQLRVHNLSQSAMTLQLFGQTMKAEDALRRALAFSERLMQDEPGNPAGAALAALLHQQLALSLEASHKYEQARQELMTALQLDDKGMLSGPEEDTLLTRMGVMRQLLLLPGQEQSERIIAELGKMLESLRKMQGRPGVDSKQAAASKFGLCNDMGQVLLERFKPADALPMFEAALEAATALKGIDPLQGETALRMAHTNLGRAFQALRDLGKAMGHYEAAEAVLARLVEREPKDLENLHHLALLHGLTGQALQDRMDLPGALARYRQAVDDLRQLASVDQHNMTFQAELAEHLQLVGGLLSVSGDHDEAARALSEGLKAVLRVTTESPSNVHHTMLLAKSHAMLGSVLADMGEARRDRALTRRGLDHLERGTSLFQALPDGMAQERDFMLAGTYADTATCLSSLGSKEAAVQAMDKAVIISQRLVELFPPEFIQALAERRRQLSGK